MGYVVPNTDVVLFKNIKLDSSYENTIYFASKQAQEAYFFDNSKVLMYLTSHSYNRTMKNSIKVKLPVATVEQCTYMAFRNKSYENKWFYCFVDDFNYVNDNNTEIVYHIDYIQTYFIGECTLLQTMVLREHAMDDTVGANRVPEPVGSDHVMYTEKVKCAEMGEYSVVVTASATQTTGYQGDFYRQGMFNGMKVTYYPVTDGSDADFIMGILKDMLGDGNYIDPADGTDRQQVTNLIMFPSAFCAETQQGNPISINMGFQINRTEISGYTPKNNKLLTAPYKSLLLTNGIGGAVTLDYDDFTIGSVSFKVTGVCTGSGEMMCVPQWYKGVENNYDYKLMINGFPQCAYTIDAYRAWVAGGGEKYQKLGVIQGIADGLFKGFKIGSVLLGNQMGVDYAYEQAGQTVRAGVPFQQTAGAYQDAEDTRARAQMANVKTAGTNAGSIVQGLANTAINYMSTEYEKGNMVNVPAGEQSASCLVANRELNFRCYELNIIRADAERIDDFFSLYGYATNKIKIPNINGRPQWNYVQTQGCAIAGNVPATIRATIEQIFDSGIRFWNNGDNIGNYSLTNK